MIKLSPSQREKSNTYEAKTELWNGSNWTEVSDLNTGRYGIMGTGASNTAALAFGGEAPPNTGKTEDWNGAVWFEFKEVYIFGNISTC